MSIENPCPMGGASIPEYEYNMRREREERARVTPPVQPAAAPDREYEAGVAPCDDAEFGMKA